MRFTFCFLFLFTASQLFSQSFQSKTIVSALHQRLFSTTTQKIHDTREWSYDAQAPVRSTPLIAKGIIYFGTTGGRFFALNETNGKERWRFSTGDAINSSAAIYNNHIYFADNKQVLYALNAANGKLAWKYAMGPKQSYTWGFDYFYSSPTITDATLFIGGSDGYLHALNADNGKVLWKYAARSVVRSSPVVSNNLVLFGDMAGRLIALNKQTGIEQWQFSTVGDTLKNEDWGFDRKAILSSPVVAGNKILFGSRDGFFYCIDDAGKELWRMNHAISWAISTPAVKDSFVITGTSDGRFVQAINLHTGKELWKFRPNSLFWSSAAIVNNHVYIGSFDGVMYCLDLKTGQRISQFNTGDKIMSSAVYSNGLLYVGSDDGRLYALTGDKKERLTGQRRFVYYEAGVNNYFRHNADLRIKNYLTNHGYKTIGPDTLPAVMNDAENAVIVFATSYFPPSVLSGKTQSLLRKFLNAGGRIVLAGANPLFFRYNEKTKQPIGFNVADIDTILGLHYGPADTRSMQGQFSCFATAAGKALNIPPHWVSSGFLSASQVDIILGVNENGSVSSYVKKYGAGGLLVQLFLHPDVPTHLDALLKAAETKF